MNKLKTTLLSGVVCTSLLMSPSIGQSQIIGAMLSEVPGAGLGMGISMVCPWCGIILSGAGAAVALLIAGIPNVMTAVNIDAAQLALEYMIYNSQKDVTYQWDPEPKESYEKAAQANEDGSQCGTGSVSGSTDEGNMNFEVQVLTTTGIEAVGLEGTTAALVTPEGRQVVMDGLSFLTTSDDGAIALKSGLATHEITAIDFAQQRNEQWLSTAGIARAELGLLSAQQAAADDGITAKPKSAPAVEEDVESTVEGGMEPVPEELPEQERNDVEAVSVNGHGNSLAGLAGSGTSTGSAMRIQALMNLELAQRFNLADTLQGEALSLSAARLLHMSNPNN